MDSRPRTRTRAAAAREDGRTAELHAARGTHALALVRDGAMPWPFDAPLDGPLCERLRALVREALAAPLGRRKRHKVGRRGYEIPLTAVSAAEWAALLPPALLGVLRAYLRDEPAVVSLALIVAPPRAPPQDPHRDHGGGPRRAVCLALSLTEAPVNTLVAAGSHASDAHAHAWTLDGLVPIAVGSRGLLYDNYVVHAGAANESDAALEERVFLTFEGASAPATVAEAAARARIRGDHGYTSHIAVPCSRLTDVQFKRRAAVGLAEAWQQAVDRD